MLLAEAVWLQFATHVFGGGVTSTLLGPFWEAWKVVGIRIGTTKSLPGNLVYLFSQFRPIRCTVKPQYIRYRQHTAACGVRLF